jgi:Flp pilus assembly pilin Flp
MLMRIFKKRAQSTAEYAVLIGLVVAAVLAMQVFVKRALQGRIQNETAKVGAQYEPYYLVSNMSSTRDTTETASTTTGGGVSRELSKDEASRKGEQTYEEPK